MKATEGQILKKHISPLKTLDFLESTLKKPKSRPFFDVQNLLEDTTPMTYRRGM